MPLNICQICEVLYPGQVNAGNIYFDDPSMDGDLHISYWAVPNVEQPTEEYLYSQEAACEQPYAVLMLNQQILPQLQILLDTTAQKKMYSSALYCLSFYNSSNPSWQADAAAFSTWRDAIRTYYFTQYAIFSQPGAPVPSLSEFMAGVTPMTWPS